MAFQQPTQRPQQQQQAAAASPIAAGASPAQQQLRKRALDEEEEEWVLFSPQSTRTGSTTATQSQSRTAGLSRLSDFGSLDTRAQSSGLVHEDDEEEGEATQHGSEDDGEGTELDSLDDGLHAFHEMGEDGPGGAGGGASTTILPTHDGLGLFPASNTLMVQEQLYAFERFNPRRIVVPPKVARRRSSVQRRLDALEEVEEVDTEELRRQRIEAWRLEQSRALLEEIERETRRMRRISRVNSVKSRVDSVAVSGPSGMPIKDSAGGEEQWRGEEDESFWQTVTRKVIRDLIGIDDSILSVIFGEELPADDITPTPSPSTSPSTEFGLGNRLGSSSGPRHETWESRLLKRIAKELGTLVHQLSEHPGAFSTYLKMRNTPEYAGLPATITFNSATTASNHLHMSSALDDMPATTRSISDPVYFEPTLPQNQLPNYPIDASLWGIEEDHPGPTDSSSDPYANNPTPPNVDEMARDKEYWERELDVKMVFNFLLKRFAKLPSVSHAQLPNAEASSSQQPHTPSGAPATSLPSSPTAANPPNTIASARRAALIRQSHPLVNGYHTPSQSRRRSSLAHTSMARHHFTNAAGQFYSTQSPLLRRPLVGSASSCKSQSTKRSKGSSRNYWDIGGSGGSGGWGEV